MLGYNGGFKIDGCDNSITSNIEKTGRHWKACWGNLGCAHERTTDIFFIQIERIGSGARLITLFLLYFTKEKL